MNFKKIFAAIFMLVLPAFASGHFIRVERLDNPKLGKSAYLFSDFHYSTGENEATIVPQQGQVVELAQQMKAAVIVEDGMPANSNEIIDSAHDIKPKSYSEKQLVRKGLVTPLHGLSSVCEHNGIACINVEQRFTEHRPLNTYFKFLENKKKQIRTWHTDGAAFEKFYTTRLAALEQQIEVPLKPVFDLMKKSPLTIGEFLDNNYNSLPQVDAIDQALAYIQTDKNLMFIHYANKIDELFRNYTCAFLDIEIIHALAQLQKNHDVILICAGDFHIECIRDILSSLGFMQTACAGENCFVQEGAYVEPTALDIAQALEIVKITQQNTALELNTFMVILITFIICLAGVIYSRMRKNREVV